ncbi:MAG: ATP-grasp fold amidoligase family protein [Solibacillus sp.]
MMKKIRRRIFTRIVKLSPVLASKIIYLKVFRRPLNLRAPRTFNEKLMWLKLKEDDALKMQCTDKYLVRDYVAQQCFPELLIDLHGIYERAEDIDFDQLPNRFVLKCTHGSGFNIVCTNKLFLDQEYARKQLNDWLKTDYSLYCGEPYYAGIKPRIIVERFIGKRGGQLPIDYNIHCFHGEPQFIEVVLDRDTAFKKHLFYTCDWELLPYTEDALHFDGVCERPVKLVDMLEIARHLSRAFTYVRVDLYALGVRIYFGELTFTPAACLDTDLLTTADELLGSYIHLEQATVPVLAK